MLRGSKGRNQAQGAFGESSGEEYRMDVDDKEPPFDENDATTVLECYFKHDPNKDKSKGVVEIAKELSVQLRPRVKLDEIRATLSKHQAFQIVSQSHWIFKKVFRSM